MNPAPTPYVLSDTGLIYGQCSEDDDEAPFVADVIDDRERAVFGVVTEQETATAEFIVMACNAHARLAALNAELLEALHDLLSDRPEIQSGGCIRCGRDYRAEPKLEGGNCPSDDCPSYRARQLLARARGGAQ
jgi:hypothetical protein